MSGWEEFERSAGTPRAVRSSKASRRRSWSANPKSPLVYFVNCEGRAEGLIRRVEVDEVAGLGASAGFDEVFRAQVDSGQTL